MLRKLFTAIVKKSARINFDFEMQNQRIFVDN